MASEIKQLTKETVAGLQQSRNFQNETAKAAMDIKLVDLFARMVKKVDDGTQAAV